MPNMPQPGFSEDDAHPELQAEVEAIFADMPAAVLDVPNETEQREQARALDKVEGVKLRPYVQGSALIMVGSLASREIYAHENLRNVAQTTARWVVENYVNTAPYIGASGLAVSGFVYWLRCREHRRAQN